MHARCCISSYSIVLVEFHSTPWVQTVKFVASRQYSSNKELCYGGVVLLYVGGVWNVVVWIRCFRCYTTHTVPMNVVCASCMQRGTSHCGHLAFVPIVVILYKTTPELRTPLQSGQLKGVHNIEVPLYIIIKSFPLKISYFTTPLKISIILKIVFYYNYEYGWSIVQPDVMLLAANISS